MSSVVKLDDYIKRLESQAKPNSNDERHGQYMKLLNAFADHFGGDQCHLVGSTSEGLKLRSRHQGGDADFILCSGKLRIPVDSLEPHEATPCYVRIKADWLPAEFRNNVVDGYLSANLVRHVHPKLFTTLRAIFTIVTTPSDSIPGRESRVTTIGMPMKVGTARKEFRNLEIEGVDNPDFKAKRRRLTQSRSRLVAARLKHRWSGVRRSDTDLALVRRILDAFTDLEVPGTGGNGFGQLNKFAALLKNVLRRPPLSDDDDDVDEEFTNNLDEEDDEVPERTYRGTCSDMTSKDFVPAVKIVGDKKLECMNAWYKRVTTKSWPSRRLADEIFHTDLFLVARDAPVDPDHRKDFCISFNLAEMKLSRCLTAVQRRVYLILKSYLNGVLKRTFDEMGLDLKLKSYYLKNALFWVCENESPSIWSDGNIINAVTKVLDYLLDCLSKKNLSHYFVKESNLFAEMEDTDFDVIMACIREIKENPIDSIEEFFAQDSSDRAEIFLSEEEVRCIQQMRDDGGDEEAVNRLEDSLIDIQRGFNASQRDENGIPPLKLACLEVLDMFSADEREKEVSQGASNVSLGGVENIRPGSSTTSLISGLLGSYVTSGGRKPADQRRVNEISDFLHIASQFSPEASRIVENFGGRSGIQSVVAQQGESKEEQRRKMREVTARYLSCTDSEAGAVRQQLKLVYAGYFLGRTEG